MLNLPTTNCAGVHNFDSVEIFIVCDATTYHTLKFALNKTFIGKKAVLKKNWELKMDSPELFFSDQPGTMGE